MPWATVSHTNSGGFARNWHTHWHIPNDPRMVQCYEYNKFRKIKEDFKYCVALRSICFRDTYETIYMYMLYVMI